MGTIPNLSRKPSLLVRIDLRFVAVAVCFVSLQLLCAGAPVSSTTPGAQRPDKPYALLFGTVWGPDNRPLYGVKVKIRRADQKKAHWELYSDHRGEFAQRVPAGPADYLISADLKGFKSSSGKELHQDGEVKIHVDNDERQDLGVHLKE